MIRGERRDIEEEIANRILSDISEVIISLQFLNTTKN